jgi:hypothetical protein
MHALIQGDENNNFEEKRSLGELPRRHYLGGSLDRTGFWILVWATVKFSVERPARSREKAAKLNADAFACHQLWTKKEKTHQLQDYADVNLLGDNMVIIKEHTETLIDASKDVGLEVNTEKTYV